MSIPRELISLFVKATKDDNKTQADVTMYGTVVYDGRPYVKIDGSDLLTPVATTTDVKDGERVTVMIKNHTATVTGNLSSPSARTTDVKEISGKISEFEIVMAYKVTAEDLEATNATIGSLRAKLATIGKLNAVEADIETLEAKFANLKYVDADDIEAITATIESLEAKFGTFTDISTDDLDALTANITTLRGYTADFTYVSADVLEAVRASVKQLDVDKLSAKDAELKYVNVEFANIDKAWMAEFYAKSGLIENVTMEDGTVTGHLVGVTIKGDVIEGNTVYADKLVIRGEDGLYYKLNFEAGTFTDAEEVPTDSLHGSIITAKSVTAEKVSVSDLVAFDATIGGFNISKNSIYSGAKASVDNPLLGLYLDNDGQLSFGDDKQFVRFYKVLDESGKEVLDDLGNPVYKLEISADSIWFGSGDKSSASDLKKLTEHVKIGTYADPNDGNEKPCVELSEGDSNFKQVITNTETAFMDGAVVKTKIDTNGLETDNLNVRNEFRQANYIWTVRTNGNMGLMWKE